MLKRALAIGYLWLAGMVLAGPTVVSQAPMGSPERAWRNLDAIAGGPWVDGNWALRMVAYSGKREARAFALIEAIGGYDPLVGRWQRLKLPGEKQFLIKGRGASIVWDLNNQQAHPLGQDELARPIFERLGLTWEVFSMSFLGYPKRNYEEVSSVMGRYCDRVLLAAEDGRSARVWLDIEFAAPLQAQIFSADGKLLRTIRAASMQKVDGQWILRRWECLETSPKNKVTLEVTAVSLGALWDQNFFDEKKGVLAWPAVEPWSFLE